MTDEDIHGRINSVECDIYRLTNDVNVLRSQQEDLIQTRAHAWETQELRHIVYDLQLSLGRIETFLRENWGVSVEDLI